MIIETKFSNGDTVYHARYRSEGKRARCETCNGTGRLKIEGHERHTECFQCFGKGWTYDGTVYLPECDSMTVGQVRVEVTASRGFGGSSFDNYRPQTAREEQYMCVETGVGSGNLYNAENLFATEAEAMDRAQVLAYEAQVRQEQSEKERKEKEEQRARLEASKDSDAEIEAC